MWLIEDPGDFSDKIEARRRIRHQDPRWSNVQLPERCEERGAYVHERLLNPMVTLRVATN